MRILSNFAVIEGGDGTGSTTQIARLKARFTPGTSPLLYNTFEPTDGPIGRMIRSYLRKELSLLPETIARLFAADRQEHLYGEGGVIARCSRGELVVSDRYIPSSLVYQGIDCGDALPRALNADFPAPELLIILDLDPETALQRLGSRPSLDRYEYLDFQKKVRERYLALVPEYEAAGSRTFILDASQSPEAVSEEIWKCIRAMPICNT